MALFFLRITGHSCHNLIRARPACRLSEVCHGRIVENGQAQKFAPNQAHLEFIPLDADDKPQPGKSFTAGVNEDGSFEVLASGGELPPGKYQVAITARGNLATKYERFAPPNSPLRHEVKAGANDFTFDETIPFQWLPSHPKFGLMANAISIMAIAFEKFIVTSTRAGNVPCWHLARTSA